MVKHDLLSEHWDKMHLSYKLLVTQLQLIMGQVTAQFAMCNIRELNVMLRRNGVEVSPLETFNSYSML